ncbi:hypothetical protein [Paraflavitalea sp. CAU 1676]|uniref:hypothetical protein n=1 Tax=Paraflavitalea sp. CAU 1676 TaxID=3032598 RepID=UPI0023DC6B00|nr:hypothetical protein [Paraflavitalea sp. CAU 1676]MDF2191261.1 hypothetical protein [Paraflavitalea sp. CAU 1676]
MKKLIGKAIYSLLIPAAVLLSFTTIRDRANFSGDWKLNESKSELGEFGGFVARTLKVEQKDNAITITRTIPGFNGGDPVTSTLTVSYDGKITETEGFGGSKRKTTAKWSGDGSALTVDNTIKFDMDGQTNEFKSTETWTIKDGTLSIVTYTNSPRGETTTKAFYTH